MKRILCILCSLVLITSCGLDKLKNSVEYDFLVKNETGSSVVVRVHYYARATSEEPIDRLVAIENGDCAALFKGLAVGEGFSYTDEEIFYKTLIGDIREDSYAEVVRDEDGKSIKWSPNEIDETSLYSFRNWTFEQSVTNGKIYKKWMLTLNDTLFQE